jgi:hypothetical protein
MTSLTARADQAGVTEKELRTLLEPAPVRAEEAVRTAKQMMIVAASQSDIAGEAQARAIGQL